MSEIRNCQLCGDEFKVYPYQLRAGQGRYCSHRCAWDHKCKFTLNTPEAKERSAEARRAAYEERGPTYREPTLEVVKARCLEEGECWIWQGAVTNAKGPGNVGTPSIRWQGRAQPVRRLVIKLKTGKDVPKGMVASAKCGNRMCVSPQCAKALTNAESKQLAASFGAYSSAAKVMRSTATKRKRSWITDEMVAAIRAAESREEAIKLTGVSPQHVSAIRRGDARRDLSNPFAGLGR